MLCECFGNSGLNPCECEWLILYWSVGNDDHPAVWGRFTMESVDAMLNGESPFDGDYTATHSTCTYRIHWSVRGGVTVAQNEYSVRILSDEDNDEENDHA